MKMIAQRYAKELLELCADLEENEVGKALQAFVDLMKERRQASLLPEVIQALGTLPEPGSVRVDLTTATEPDAALSENLRKDLERHIGSPVEIEQHQDPDLIGGAVIRYEDILLDASVRNRLDHLKQQLSA